MKDFKNKFYLVLSIIATISFINCNNSDDNFPKELTIQEKVELLEGHEWFSENGNRTPNVKFTFSEGKQYNSYLDGDIWHNNSTVSSADYVLEGSFLKMDFYFGNVYTYEIKVTCDNNIVMFISDGELHTTLYKRGSNYNDCL